MSKIEAKWIKSARIIIIPFLAIVKQSNLSVLKVSPLRTSSHLAFFL